MDQVQFRQTIFVAGPIPNLILHMRSFGEVASKAVWIRAPTTTAVPELRKDFVVCRTEYRGLAALSKQLQFRTDIGNYSTNGKPVKNWGTFTVYYRALAMFAAEGLERKLSDASNLS